ncbi:unnamed protein product [Ilex paraguariensis]|uniref:Leucine-rich repeat-containing N-terminal plant-type domain-containing protein n=1 Tax=Ilex paraguariensis TaxID=185542 RepID=A0ABC8T707_9AQUA
MPPAMLPTCLQFSNTSVGFICHFVGVSCWDGRPNRLLSLQLRDMSLASEIPDALQYCQSLQTLDLSGNSLSGSIPAQICSWFPYLVTLDLSNNSLTGSIPADLGNCSYLNNLILSNNKLSGNIPRQIFSLNRLKKISAANNDLSGEIPPFSNSTIIPDDFAGNSGLCGDPLGRCGGLNKKKIGNDYCGWSIRCRGINVVTVWSVVEVFTRCRGINVVTVWSVVECGGDTYEVESERLAMGLGETILVVWAERLRAHKLRSGIFV